VSLLLLYPTELERTGVGLPEFEGVSAAVCGMGLVAAGIGAARHLAVGRFDACLLVGVAGARSPEPLAQGSLVVGTAVRNEAIGCGHGDEFLPLGRMAPAGEQRVRDVFDLAPPPGLAGVDPTGWAERLGLTECFAGVIGSVAAASADPAAAQAWSTVHPDVLVEEMEGYAVAHACRDAGTPLSIVRSVSNRAGQRDKASWNLQGALAVLTATLPALLEGGRS
jgi:futalosine hydrolase